MQKRYTLILLFCGLSFFIQAQDKLSLSLQHLSQNEKKYHLNQEDLESFKQVHEASLQKSGATTLYLQQTLDGIEIQNAMLVVTLDKFGKVVHVGNSAISQLKSIEKIDEAKMKMDEAAVFAAKHLGVLRPETPTIAQRSEDGFGVLRQTSYTKQDMQVKPAYVFKEGKLHLTHQITLEMAESADYWQINVSKKDGNIINQHNYTLYCSHQSGKYSHDETCFHENQNTNIKAFKTANNQQENTFSASSAKYNVYPFPTESPVHGAQTIVVDPHFVEASPFGWHDNNGIEGPEFLITRGNNAYAYADKDDNDLPDSDTPIPNGGDTLVFNYTHDLTLEPLANAGAAQTNLFYAVNMMHDITFLYGFDEAAGNFQTKNYSGLGKGNDAVNANAFDGLTLTTPKLNNANFSTPTDGNSGKMQMYLWNRAAGAVNITEPEELITTISEYGLANGFGVPIPSSNDEPVIGSLALATDNSLSPTRVCRTANVDLTGKIALVDRGECDFSEKIYNVQQKGAVACFICNASGINGGNGEELINMSGGTNAENVDIPAILMKKSDCDRLKSYITRGLDIKIKLQSPADSGPAYLDGAFDNGIIAHEFGHGISTRLTGGPGNSGCLSNAEQMGEGWSDFFALATTVKEGDLGTNPRGIGAFASAQQANGNGIRRYPYATDMLINPQTFDNIKGTTSEHAIGEIWADCLWDLYWAMADAHGFDANIKNTESGNGKAIQLVMNGMIIQGCNPGFIEGRNAILAADELLFGGENNCLIWNAFARRGLGYFADGGSANDSNDGKEDFEALPTCIEKLKISKKVPQIVTAGASIPVELKAINHVKSDLTGVFVEDELAEGSTYIAGSSNFPAEVNGNTIRFNIGNMAYEQEVIITYSVIAPLDKSETQVLYDIDGGVDGFDIDITVGFDTWTIAEEGAKSGTLAFYIQNTLDLNDHSLLTPNFPVKGERPVLRFFQKFDTEAVYDGGFVQISKDNGNSWENIPEASYLRNGPTDDISYSTIPIPGLRGFSGNSNGYIDTYIDLANYKNLDVKFKFRFATDTAVTVQGGGWWIDDIELMDLKSTGSVACINDVSLDKEACTAEQITIINSDVALNNQDEALANFSVKLVPNPANGYVNLVVDSEEKMDAKVMIRSLDGKVIKSSKATIFAEINTINLDINELKPGMYIIELLGAKNRFSQKLIVY
ncbi:MAG: M36 family metallopeptidase [Saprospiraceae bacterium]|nr:M36 family metallopeptidase [Saprospiraceae bacterium]